LKKLYTEESFIDGGVRLMIEYGEPYESTDFLLKILYDIDVNYKELKDFIGDPNKITVSDLKKFFCENFILKAENYMFYKTNWIRDPVKAMKNETLLLSKFSLNDGDCLYLKDNSSELFETYLIKFYKEDCYDKFVFTPISESSLLLELNVSKDLSLGELKLQIGESLGISAEDIRLRILGRKFDPERILRGDSTIVKKFNINNPGNLLIEIIPNEILKDNQLQLHFFKRDSNRRIYMDKEEKIWEYNTSALSDQLYNFVREFYNLDNITLIKYSKYYYTWEIIPEKDNKGPLNLRKNPYNIKDGDWIGIKEGDQEDDYQTDEDRRVCYF
jgi:hypothetical protein